jgi:hypothetical protein
MELLVGPEEARLFDPAMHPDVVILNSEAITGMHFAPIVVKQEAMETETAGGDKDKEPSVPGMD